MMTYDCMIIQVISAASQGALAGVGINSELLMEDWNGHYA